MSTEKRNVAILAACQALLLTANVTVIALAGLVGHSLAENKALATLPVSTFIIGVALTTIPASQWMRRVGRRHGFMTGTGFGILGALICSYAVLTANFWLYCFGTVFLGTNNAFGQQYRFAAAESATSEFKAKAISWVLAAGIVVGTYLAVVVLCAFAMALLSRLDLPRTSAEKRGETGRPLCEIMRQPVFIVAVLGAMVGYAVMNLVMTAGPLAMIACSIPYASTIFVVEWHIIGMFAPSFFTGSLIQRFGVLNIMLAGVVLLFGSVAAAVTGISFVHFWTSLFLLGIGWNFLFVGGTTLLTESYTAAEKAKTQGMNDFLVFGSVAVASLSSGGLLHFFGWNAVNLGAVPFLFLTGAATLWLMARRRNAARHPA
jgi:MFS family permease